MKSLKIHLHERLPRLGDRLPFCGKFYRNVPWTGLPPCPYPAWFMLMCRLECSVIKFLYRWTYE